ncbi:mitochondrial processing protease [Scheffersomyces stipitis CBS 6054]|uniref:mitochondrial processing peptidase n=1 Tax=Scheffersomyces stipitis (strain ATCC 58785 / CBS 6054 / NBRC 10063 / NRRL Y-11545) TaxID=322104 RepID=A3LXK3_PICST|nr:mitochondrial processing protease [Scheffersomyces stipitis CBS 6054]ABN67819.1 mitochondrial processing protease [Scheffersomyces stipitis CBS 6054]
MLARASRFSRSTIAGRRLFTTASPVPTFQTSVLPNGLTVASESMPGTRTATVGVWINAGSRADNPASSGTAHFLEHLAFKGTNKRSQLNLELEIENIGSQINAYTSRENTVYYTKCLETDINQNIDILSDLLTKSKLEERAIENERHVILQESDEVDKMYDEVVFDHLHAVAFKSQDLGRTILGPRELIKTIQRDDLVNYITTNYKGDRMALIGVGCVNHEDLVKQAQKYFGDIKKSEKPFKQSGGDLPVFYGDEIRIQDDSLPTTHVALAVEGVSWSAPDFFTASVANGIIGTWDRSIGVGSNSPSPLAVTAAIGGAGNTPIANSYMAYTTSYADTGLMGVYFTADKDANLKLFIDAVMKEWARLKSGDITVEEVERSKAQLKASLVLALDDSTAIAEDIGRQLVNTGFRLSPEEVFERVEAITKKDVIDWANYRLKDKPIALSAVGNVKTLPSHQYLTKGMSL